MAEEAKAAPLAQPDDVTFVVLEGDWDVFRSGAVIRADAGVREQLEAAGVAYRQATDRERSLAGK